ncbi:MAG TPA: hypothetical protein PKA13_05745 [Geminicoccaceae bacterium]|nr:hypothetical protein [Geminicoccus sp.]HMU49257.1 hypothetical protein [Geminicoccaceae bacterium]
MSPDERILAQRPFAMKPEARRDLYATEPQPLFAESSTATLLIASDMSVQQATKLLEEYLQSESLAIRGECVRLFEDDAVIAKIPSPILRAAFSTLPTTSCASAIESILSDSVSSISFNEDPTLCSKSYSLYFARAFQDADLRMNYYFNPYYRGLNTNPMLFTCLMAHEPLHRPDRSTDLEEAVATSFETFVLIEQLSRHSLIDSTRLGRRMATRAAFRLNCGHGATMGLYRTNGDKALIPDSNATFRNWIEYIKVPPGGRTLDWTLSPGNELLGAYCRAIGITDAGPSPRFDEDLLHKIDRAPYPSLPPSALLAAARNLGMEVPEQLP